MKTFVVLASLFSFTPLMADVNGGNVNDMINQMVTNEVFTQKEANEAREKLKSITPEQWQKINSYAKSLGKRSPASSQKSNNKIEEVHGIDFDSAEFKQIQKDLSGIIK